MVNVCQPCSSVCVTCSVAAENCTSTTCPQNLFFLSNQCLSSCPDGYYADTALRQCKACATECLKCFGAGAAACTKCSASAYLQIGLTTCAATCNPGEYANSVNNECTECNPACALCTSPTVCQSCQSVNGLGYFLDVNKCTVKCPSDKFGNTGNFQCVGCADGCATCYGPAIT